MKEISLTQNQIAIVDDEDYPILSQWKWCALWNPFTKTYYAVRKEKLENKRRSLVYMHRQILGFGRGNRTQVDHRDGNTLLNTRDNIRPASATENGRNAKKRIHNTSGYTGVSQSSPNSFQAFIRVNKKKVYLGSRSTAKAAYEELYLPAAKKFHGEFFRPEAA